MVENTADSDKENIQTTEEYGWVRFKDKIEIPYGASDPPMGQIRGLMTEMKVEKDGEAAYRVTDHVGTFNVNMRTEECSCSTHDGFKCRHRWHMKYRIETNSLPD